VFHDIPSRTAALNMAIDEVLLETAVIPSIRFYKWDHPALSFGYFGKFTDVAVHATERDLVRRWTGGGIVFHRDDLTYSIVIPAADPAFFESAMSIYAEIHASLCRALAACGQNAELAAVEALYERRPEINSAVIDRRYNKDACFDNPVRADVLSNGRKVAGAAQRRTRRGLLQQGSIQVVDLTNKFADQFARELCSECFYKMLDQRLISRAHEIAETKYGAASWLQRR
jgi:lipoate-protein ligase A